MHGDPQGIGCPEHRICNLLIFSGSVNASRLPNAGLFRSWSLHRRILRREKKRRVRMTFIGTTCLISETSKPRPNPRVVEFIANNAIVLPSTVITEIERGILRVSVTDPQRSSRLRDWLTSQSEVWPVLHGREHEAARVLAEMLECRPLRNVWLPQPKTQNPKLAYHVFVAASAIAYDLPVATIGTECLSIIDAFFPLPGIFCATNGSWTTATPARWSSDQPTGYIIPSAA